MSDMFILQKQKKLRVYRLNFLWQIRGSEGKDSWTSFRTILLTIAE